MFLYNNRGPAFIEHFLLISNCIHHHTCFTIGRFYLNSHFTSKAERQRVHSYHEVEYSFESSLQNSKLNPTGIITTLASRQILIYPFYELKKPRWLIDLLIDVLMFSGLYFFFSNKELISSDHKLVGWYKCMFARRFLYVLFVKWPMYYTKINNNLESIEIEF